MRRATTPAAELPRAIAYTAALYSIGLPPEFLGLGSGLREIAKQLGPDAPAQLLTLYPGLRDDVTRASAFLSLEVAAQFLPPRLLRTIGKELDEAEAALDIPIRGVGDKHYLTYLEIAAPLFRALAARQELASEDETLLRTSTIRLGKMRGSLG